jgi:hypothetical protein
MAIDALRDKEFDYLVVYIAGWIPTNSKKVAQFDVGGDQFSRDLFCWVEPETPTDVPNVHRPNVIEHKVDPSMYDVSGY